MSSTTTKPTPRRFKINKNDLFLHIFLISVGLMIALPILLAIFTSFKLPEDVTNYPPTLFPEKWTFANYKQAWNATPLWRFFINSLIQTGGIVIAQVLFSILAAYAFAVL
ncbi:MAG: carbohydrate ABC transporter permease, partial [Methylococcales bacterium]|nr:carbohydrate ABC transporter permease [Methylococcales bacterium]